jgi:hypothetical protein
MKKVNLDKEYDKWLVENEGKLIDDFLDIHNFNDYEQEAWREYMDENGLVDESYDS